ncbi:MAG: haloacid dehalogenase type II [Rhodomicrobium sp.]|nr:haloacid dehalogenase type II [Rhodomicrobium sp.]
MPASQSLKACVFDAYGTLFDVHAPAAVFASELGERAPAISAQWRTKQLEYTWLRSLMGCYVDFAQVTADALDYALAANGLSGSPVRDKLLRLYTSLDAYPDAAACLEAVKKAGARTGILSNGSPSMLAGAVTSAKLGSLLDYVISVDSVRIYKPSPEVYKLAPNAFGVEPDEIAFISGNGWDCAGAAAFGFHVIQVNRSNQADERLGVEARAQVRNLNEAAAHIARMLP